MGNVKAEVNMRCPGMVEVYMCGVVGCDGVRYVVVPCETQTILTNVFRSAFVRHTHHSSPYFLSPCFCTVSGDSTVHNFLKGFYIIHI